MSDNSILFGPKSVVHLDISKYKSAIFNNVSDTSDKEIIKKIVDYLYNSRIVILCKENESNKYYKKILGNLVEFINSTLVRNNYFSERNLPLDSYKFIPKIKYLPTEDEGFTNIWDAIHDRSSGYKKLINTHDYDMNYFIKLQTDLGREIFTTVFKIPINNSNTVKFQTTPFLNLHYNNYTISSNYDGILLSFLNKSILSLTDDDIFSLVTSFAKVYYQYILDLNKQLSSLLEEYEEAYSILYSEIISEQQYRSESALIENVDYSILSLDDIDYNLQEIKNAMEKLKDINNIEGILSTGLFFDQAAEIFETVIKTISEETISKYQLIFFNSIIHTFFNSDDSILPSKEKDTTKKNELKNELLIDLLEDLYYDSCIIYNTYYNNVYKQMINNSNFYNSINIEGEVS